MTFGSGDARGPESERAVIPSRGQRVGNAAELARNVIERVASGSVTAGEIDALAAAVLDDELVRLALAVRAGGPHATRRAIELAALILAMAGKRR